MLARAAQRRPSIGPGTALVLAALLLLIVLYAPVIIGARSLIGGDILYQLPPWSGAAGAHPPRNPLVSDPVLQMLAWQGLVRDAFAHLRLPLWNPMALSGSPLLANDQSAAFSPFTWLALPFKPAYGLSLAMLAKLCVAAVGMGLYLRALGARPVPAVLAGIIYAGSSFMVVWLAWPQSGVAALIPFAFAAVEWYLRGGRRIALAALSAAIALQFFAGHAETSLHMGGALAIYALIRALSLDGPRVRRVIEIGLAALAGVLLAGIQLLPFIAMLGRSSLSADRAAAGFGLGHLHLTDLSSWLVPNARGNPGIDHLLGRPPNYNESTGFATVTALLLAPIGLWRSWIAARSVAVGLGGIGLLSAGIAYGPLTPIAGRLPGLSVSGNERLIAVVCFVLAAAAGLGLDALLSMKPVRRPSRALGLFGAGAVALLGIAGCALLLLARGARVDQLLPAGPRGYLGFWLLVAALSLAAALLLIAALWNGVDRFYGVGGIALLTLLEVALFAGPYNPRVPMNEVPPSSQAMTFLQRHGGVAAAPGLYMAPEASTLYGVTDARGYDVLIDRRERAFWSLADPGYHDQTLFTMLGRPDARFLAAAGVNYFMSAADAPLPGTDPVYSGEGVTIAAVPGARPFAFIAGETADVPSAQAAATSLAADPLGPVVIEGCCAQAASSSGARVNLISRDPQRIQLRVDSDTAAVVVLLQAYDAGWAARIDGKPAAIHPANILFQAIAVPAGSHDIALSYAPASVTVGALLTGLGLLVLVAVIAWEVRSRQ